MIPFQLKKTCLKGLQLQKHRFFCLLFDGSGCTWMGILVSAALVSRAAVGDLLNMLLALVWWQDYQQASWSAAHPHFESLGSVFSEQIYFW